MAGYFQLSVRDQFYDELHFVRTRAHLREHFTSAPDIETS
jgi:hypothetical protein